MYSRKIAKYEKFFNSPIDECYRCEKTGFDLVSPCGNSKCEAKIHPVCLEKQVEEGGNICIKCEQTVIVEKVKKLNVSNYCDKFLSMFVIGILMFFSIAIPGLFIFARSIVHLYLGEMWLIGLIASVMVALIISLCYISIFIYMLNNKNKYSDRIDNYLPTCIMNASYLWKCSFVMFLLLVTTIIYIGFCHVIGIIIFLCVSDFDNIFTFNTFITGSCIITALIIVCLIIWGITRCCICFYEENLEEKTVFGTRK